MGSPTAAELKKNAENFTSVVIAELKSYGVDLSNNVSAKAAIVKYFKENQQPTQMTPQLLRTLLGYEITRIDPIKLIEIEKTYYLDHGFKLPQQFSSSLRTFFTDPFGAQTVFSYSANALSAYDSASKFLFSHLEKMTDEERRLRPLVFTSYAAFRFNMRLLELYKEGKTNTEEFRIILNQRDRTLEALGFKNLDKVAGMGSRPDSPILLDVDTPDLRKWNIDMVSSFLAPILMTADKTGLTTLDQSEQISLKESLKSNAARWGYVILGSFMSELSAQYLRGLSRNI